MTDDVAALVLRDNYFQTQALSVAGRLGAAAARRAGALHPLPGEGRASSIARSSSCRPTTRSPSATRARAWASPRPSGGAAGLRQDVAVRRDRSPPTCPRTRGSRTALERYFPTAAAREVRAPTSRAIRCKREIIATHVLNSMVNRVGPTFVHRLGEITGATPAQVVRAYLATREVVRPGARCGSRSRRSTTRCPTRCRPRC